MLDEMSESEFRGWTRYFQVEPWGEEMDWYKFGTVSSVLVNINRDPKKTDAFSPEDFVPEMFKVKRTKEENQKAIRNSFMSAFGARITEKGPGHGGE
jgi:hypothetical protein